MEKNRSKLVGFSEHILLLSKNHSLNTIFATMRTLRSEKKTGWNKNLPWTNTLV